MKFKITEEHIFENSPAKEIVGDISEIKYFIKKRIQKKFYYRKDVQQKIIPKLLDDLLKS